MVSNETNFLRPAGVWLRGMRAPCGHQISVQLFSRVVHKALDELQSAALLLLRCSQLHSCCKAGAADWVKVGVIAPYFTLGAPRFINNCAFSKAICYAYQPAEKSDTMRRALAPPRHSAWTHQENCAPGGCKIVILWPLFHLRLRLHPMSFQLMRVCSNTAHEFVAEFFYLKFLIFRGDNWILSKDVPVRKVYVQRIFCLC